MKRFITYLYEYEGDSKSKNTGFICVDERNGLVKMQVSIRKLIRSHEKGKVYALRGNSSLSSIELGEIVVLNGQGDMQIHFKEKDIMGTGHSLDEIVGIGIWFGNSGYLASCWKDEATEDIGCWKPWQRNESQNEDENADIMQSEEDLLVSATTENEQMTENDAVVVATENTSPIRISYQKMELTQIRMLPSKNWYLCNNRFLQHGFWGYGYLVLKKEMANDKEVVSLGVPGVYEEPEMAMATLFGFSKFEALPMEIQTASINESIEATSFWGETKSQKPKSGTFGCWLIPLQS